MKFTWHLIVSHFSKSALIFFLCALSLSAENKKPNFVFILLDDMGQRDLGCYGSKFYQSPNIDKLAAQGMRFTDAYAACVVCSPTRASILTGKYPARLHLTDFIPGRKILPDQKLQRPNFLLQLPLEEITLPEMLKSAGYISGAFGKWHLGGVGFEPEKQGFDIYSAGDKKASEPGSSEPGKGEYGITEEALEFIDQNKDRPFFLYLPYHSPHIPLRAPRALVEKYEKLREPNAIHTNFIYAAMIESVDTQIGRVIAKLDDLKLAENTVVIFTSDNGGLSVAEGQQTPATSNFPWRYGKGYLNEGGIRVPLIVRWPGRIKAGTISSNVVCSIDHFPTILELARVAVPEKQNIDGVSLVSLLTKKEDLKPRPLFWHYPHYSNQGGDPGGVMREGDFKLIQWFENGRCELYNLRADPSEKTNLMQTMPRKAGDMIAQLDRWRRTVGAQMMLPNPEYDPRAKRSRPIPN